MCLSIIVYNVLRHPHISEANRSFSQRCIKCVWHNYRPITRLEGRERLIWTLQWGSLATNFESQRTLKLIPAHACICNKARPCLPLGPTCNGFHADTADVGDLFSNGVWRQSLLLGLHRLAMFDREIEWFAFSWNERRFIVSLHSPLPWCLQSNSPWAGGPVY